MPIQDIHNKRFTDDTIVKLNIFELYAKEWIPTFVMSGCTEICIVDFFAGPGYDKDQQAGSPIRILEQVKKHLSIIKQKNVKISIFLNELKLRKYQNLVKNCTNFIRLNPQLENTTNIEYLNEDFERAFDLLLPKIRRNPALVYLDQNGVKFTADKYLLELEKSPRTDFLYFVSSSFIERFGGQEEFRNYLEVDMEEVKKSPRKFIHQYMLSYLRSRLPKGSQLKLYPFSLKKSLNVYGIIFGSSHARGVDKFLKVAWGQNPDNGKANFDIHDDRRADPEQLGLFALLDKDSLPQEMLTTVEAFQREVQERVLNGDISNNMELFQFAQSQGHLGKHAADKLKEMKNQGKVDYSCTSPLVTYENVYSKKRIIDYQVIGR